MKIKNLAITLLLSSFILGQEEISNNLNTAVVKFESTGINDMENQAFFEYFLQELTNSSQNNFIDQKLVNQKTKSLDLTTNSCFTNECLKAAMDSTNSDELIAGTIQFSKNKFRVKIHKIESSKNKSKTYNIRYKGEVDGFITELQILAWEIMGKNPPGTLSAKRKPSRESFLENPTNKRILVFTIAGLAGASYVSNTAGYNKSMDGANNDREIFYDDHIASANKSKNEANLSLVVMIASLGYAYYDGLLKFGDK
ncbi:MAG: hypothetical protein ACJZ1P_05440 [Candidatus Neomarinimicrobiota bacterium]